MFGPKLRGASAYETTGVETGVMSADPHKLVLMLFEGARLAIARALLAMEQGDIARKGESIGRAVKIVMEGLNASLSWDANQEMADRLASLYEYMARRLTEGNAQNNPDPLREADRLLAELENAWRAIAPERRAQLDAGRLQPA
ncbi:MAG: flagellar export chaperone FliS [Pseudomonadota bacterium]|nr:flagellar export chaperone FliS [Pseudomonadota bacterium]